MNLHASHGLRLPMMTPVGVATIGQLMPNASTMKTSWPIEKREKRSWNSSPIRSRMNHSNRDSSAASGMKIVAMVVEVHATKAAESHSNIVSRSRVSSTSLGDVQVFRNLVRDIVENTRQEGCLNGERQVGVGRQPFSRRGDPQIATSGRHGSVGRAHRRGLSSRQAVVRCSRESGSPCLSSSRNNATSSAEPTSSGPSVPDSGARCHAM